MRIYQGFTVGLLLVLLGLSACQARLPSVVTPAPLPTETVAALFQDDFSNSQSGWRQLDTAGGRAAYADGVYQMRVDGANYNVMSTSGQSFSDVRIEVDAIKTPGERNNRFGLICRAADAANLYVFLISSDGFYGIAKVVQGQPQLIGLDALLPSEKIPQGSGVNHLRADCVGSRLALYVNGEKIFEVQDTDLAAGEVGLIAGSYSPQGTEILFDNFKVYAP